MAFLFGVELVYGFCFLFESTIAVGDPTNMYAPSLRLEPNNSIIIIITIITFCKIMLSGERF